MNTAIRCVIALAGASHIVAGAPVHGKLSSDSGASQTSAEEPTTGATDEVPNQDFYCGARKLGTWFYCDKPKPRPSIKPAPAVASAAASERLAAISKQLIDVCRQIETLETDDGDVLASSEELTDDAILTDII